MSQILDLNLKNACHNIQKSSGSCSALIVHLEIGHCTVINMKDLNVLTADINDGMNVREQEVSSPCVARITHSSCLSAKFIKELRP